MPGRESGDSHVLTGALEVPTSSLCLWMSFWVLPDRRLHLCRSRIACIAMTTLWVMSPKWPSASSANPRRRRCSLQLAHGSPWHLYAKHPPWCGLPFFSAPTTLARAIEHRQPVELEVFVGAATSPMPDVAALCRSRRASARTPSSSPPGRGRNKNSGMPSPSRVHGPPAAYRPGRCVAKHKVPIRADGIAPAAIKAH